MHNIDSVNIIALLTFRVKHGSGDTLTYGNGYWMIGAFIVA